MQVCAVIFTLAVVVATTQAQDPPGKKFTCKKTCSGARRNCITKCHSDDGKEIQDVKCMKMCLPNKGCETICLPQGAEKKPPTKHLRKLSVGKRGKPRCRPCPLPQFPGDVVNTQFCDVHCPSPGPILTKPRPSKFGKKPKFYAAGGQPAPCDKSSASVHYTALPGVPMQPSRKQQRGQALRTLKRGEEVTCFLQYDQLSDNYFYFCPGEPALIH